MKHEHKSSPQLLNELDEIIERYSKAQKEIETSLQSRGEVLNRLLEVRLAPSENQVAWSNLPGIFQRADASLGELVRDHIARILDLTAEQFIMH